MLNNSVFIFSRSIHTLILQADIIQVFTCSAKITLFHRICKHSRRTHHIPKPFTHDRRFIFINLHHITPKARHMKNIPTDIFNLTTVKRPVAQGSILVAEPFLGEQYFRHAVITLIDHGNDDGSMGVVLNIPSGFSLDELIEGINPDIDIPVFCGGPVSLDRLYFIHTLGDRIIPGASQFAPGLWVGGEFPAIIDYINSGYRTDGIIRFFLGYAGWTRGQLLEEIDQSVWAVAYTPATDSSSFTDPSQYPLHPYIKPDTSYIDPSQRQINPTPLSHTPREAITPGTPLAPHDLLTKTGDSLWHHVVRHMGTAYHGWLLHPRDLHAN